MPTAVEKPIHPSTTSTLLPTLIFFAILAYEILLFHSTAIVSRQQTLGDSFIAPK
ncbi:MAG: hypothetical protein GY820_37975 [Gammaproteobacteria bacterium]|nr:hypothetical protein [Gammaproteobacteria bacterium]